jgi:hypothetical protein
MPFYPAGPSHITPAARGEDAAVELVGRAGMVAVQVQDLAGEGRPLGAGRAGAGRIGTGVVNMNVAGGSVG